MIVALLSFALASLLIELTPGPNMAYLAILAADRGKKAGLAAVGGVALGLALLGLLAVLGLGALLVEQPGLFQALRWAGVAYLLYLAWEAWSDARKPIEAPDPMRGSGAISGAVSSPICSIPRRRFSTSPSCPASCPRARAARHSCLA